MPHETWMKAQAVIPRLPELRQLVRNLEQRVATLEEQLKNAPAQSARNKKPNLGKK
jgi:UDP-3-O-[3-hydroxymyristoyl] glucosamine N-acyltransferase